MSILVYLFLIGISLSMDTFSISLSIGTFNISRNKGLFLCIFIGILHFFMPLFGNFIGSKIVTFLQIDVNFLLGIILLIIALELIIDLFKKSENFFQLSIISMLLIAFSVSLDSFSTGLGLSAVTTNYYLSGFIFSVCAFSFTLMGLLIGKYSTKLLGTYANFLGIILLIILGIVHLFK